MGALHAWEIAAYLGIGQGLLRICDGLLLQAVFLVEFLSLGGDERGDSVLCIDLLLRVACD